MVPKRKFEFEPTESLVDIYLNGKKVRAKHNGTKGHIYLYILPDEKYKIDVAPHDSRIGIEVEIKDGRVVPLKIERKFQSKSFKQQLEVEAKTILRDDPKVPPTWDSKNK